MTKRKPVVDAGADVSVQADASAVVLGAAPVAPSPPPADGPADGEPLGMEIPASAMAGADPAAALGVLDAVVAAAPPVSDSTDPAQSDIFAAVDAASPPPAKRKPGWPKGRPRKGWGRPSDDPVMPRVTILPDDDPATVATKLHAENARLTAENASLRARLDPETSRLVKSSIAGLVMLAGTVAQRQYGDHWMISRDEATEAGEHCGNALIPFLGDFAKYTPFALAIGSLAAIAIPRMQAEEEIRQGRAPRLRNGEPYVVPVAVSG